MREILLKVSEYRETASSTGFAITVMLLSILAGCATDGKVQSAKIMEEPAVSMTPSLERLADGREGFIIRETPDMDEPSRRDFDRAVALLINEEYEEAMVLLENVIEKSPGVTAPYINMAIACRRTGKLEQAEEHLKKALQLVPDHPAACNEYGLLYRKTGRFAEAREIYQKVLTRFPDYYPVHRNLGVLCDLYLNDLTCALEHYEIYSEAMPEDRQVELWVADLRGRLGQN